MTDTAIALTLAPRTDTISRLLPAIREARPKRLYVISDEGRSEMHRAKFNEAKALIAAIDWCEVHTNYAQEHMGVKRRLASGFSWVFDQEERAIILEHDCLPHPTFFRFCEELLERYKDDERVMHISGDNFFSSFGVEAPVPDSYFFARIPHIWGWASWRRAWRFYDPELRSWPSARVRRTVEGVFGDSAVAHRWSGRFEDYYRGRIESWDGQWSFAVVSQNGLCINPSVNLVSNIGFGPQAFSTKDIHSPLADVPVHSMTFPLRHPPSVAVNETLEAYTQRYVFDINRTFLQRFKWFWKSRFPALYDSLKKITGRP